MSSEEMEGLEGLGVSVKNQESLENDILGMIAQRIKLKEQDVVVKQVKKELNPLIQNIKQTLRKKRLFEKEIKHIHNSSSSITSQQNRRISTLIDDQDSLEKHINELFSSQKTLLQRLKDCDYNYDEDPEINPWKIGATIEEEETNEEPETETELQKNIRLGDVTAFGTTLHTISSTSEDSKIKFDDYLQQQIQNQGGSLKRKRANSSDSDSGFIDIPLKKTKEESIDKGKVLTTKIQKSKRISRLVNHDADIEIDADNGYVGQNLKPGEKVTVHLEDDSEWQPSGSEEEEKFIKKKKVKRGKKAQINLYDDEGGWKTDDSDWEGTDDEEAPKKRRGKTDDGDKDLYMSRIASWQANRSEEEKLLDGKFEELDGGLKAPTSLWNKLYNYQKVGVQWMFELHQQKCGGILGDEMGLGKTIQVIAFLASLSYSQITWSGSSWRGLGPTIIVCPTTLLHQWVSEFHKWWPPLRVAVFHTSGSHTGSKTNLIRAINSSGGILIMSYQAIAAHIDQISNLKWHYIILDEGHKIRNPDAKVTLAVKQIATPNRLILSGSPMQNNLKELWSLFDFIYPGKLGTLPVFMQQFSGPITQGGYANASSVQVATAFKCATVLKDTIGPYLLRRMKADVKKHIKLPEKNEQVLFCRLTEEQRSLYRAYIDGQETKSILSGHLKVFVGLIALRQICNHADLHSGGPKIENIDPAELEPEDNFGWYKRSGKMIVVHSLLKLWKKQGHRVLLFSQSRKMIAILEAYVKEQGYKYLRLDGGTAIGSRQKLITKFNDGDTFVFILTTKVGGLGVNLTGANRVVIFDPDWNPSTDTQARERSWRIGQEKQVTIYRLMTAGTIEEKIYHRQIFKQFLVNRVLKDPKQRRFFKSNDLYELFTLTEATEEDNTETSAIFAGTGSDIKVKPKHKKEKTPNYSVPVFKPVTKKKKEADGAEKDVKKSLNRLYDEDAHTSESIQTSENTNGSSLTDEMRQKLREQAKRISAKFSENKQKLDNTSVDESSKIINSDNQDLEPKQVIVKSTEEFGSRLENSQNISIPITNKRSDENSIDTSKSKDPDITETTKNSKPNEENKPTEKHHKSHKSHKSHKHKHKKHKHKHSKYKDSRFEGERLSHLVKSRKYKPPIQDVEEQEKTSENQDNYVLAKLFAKSGVHSAVQHDAIIDGGGPDYAIVESEASEIAKQAVMAMKESRRECLRAEAGVPNWTGNNGGLKKPKFGAKKRKPGPNMNSTDLLALMKNRNMLVSTVPKDTEEESDLFRPDHQGSSTRPKKTEVDPGNLDLLADIRNFIAFQAAVDGEASTSEVVGKFQRSLPSQQSPLFKAFLQQICDFRRNHEGKGIWRLKPEFR